MYNACHGGFSLSKLAAMWLAARGVDEAAVWLAAVESDPGCSGWGDSFYPSALARHSGLLAECVAALGKDASGPFSDVRTADVADLYRIEEYDGLESVVEPGDVRWTSALRDPEGL